MTEPVPNVAADVTVAADAPLEVTTRSLVAGGAAIGKADDGRVVLVQGALPGEQVVVADPVARRRMITGTVESLVRVSPARVTPPCPSVAAGCGGCDLQYAHPDHLPELKVGIVADALAHLGGVRTAHVTSAPPLAPWGFRTSVRVVADATGRAAFRRHRSHELVVPGHCLVVHPDLDALLTHGRFPPGVEVVARVSARSGERLVVVDAPLDEVVVPDGVSVVGRGGVRGAGWLREWVAGRWWRISGTSFFQTRPDGADALVAEVLDAAAVAGEVGVSPTGTAVDAYAGVGLFAGALRDAGWTGPVAAVERQGSATADAEANLADDGVVVVGESVDSWTPVPASLVVADPARSGLGQQAADVLAGTDAGAIVLVSCDAAALGRDVRLLREHGYAHQRSVVVDMFPHTHHVEVVTLLLAGRP